MNEKRVRKISNSLLLLTALIWGIAFVAQSAGMEHVGPWTFVFTRFILAAAVLFPVSKYIDRKNKKKAVKPAPLRLYITGGACCGLFLGIASITQQAGIKYTTAGKAGFITALYVIFIPVLAIFLKKKPQKKIWFCVLLGLAGLYLISVKDGFSIEKGDTLVMICAIVFSMQILSVDHFSVRVPNVVKLSDIQFFFAAVVGLIGMLIFESPDISAILSAIIPIAYAGILSSAVGYTLQIIAQKNTDPTVASLLMSLESVFAALAGWLLLHQTLSVRELIGCGIVMLAVVIAQLPSKRRDQA